MIGLILATMVAVGDDGHASADAWAQAMETLDRVDQTHLAVNYRDELLQDVLADLNAHLPVPLRAEWAILKRIGVEPNDRVTLRLVNPSGLTALSAFWFRKTADLVRDRLFPRAIDVRHRDDVSALGACTKNETTKIN